MTAEANAPIELVAGRACVLGRLLHLLVVRVLQRSESSAPLLRLYARRAAHNSCDWAQVTQLQSCPRRRAQRLRAARQGGSCGMLDWLRVGEVRGTSQLRSNLQNPFRLMASAAIAPSCGTSRRVRRCGLALLDLR